MGGQATIVSGEGVKHAAIWNKPLDTLNIWRFTNRNFTNWIWMQPDLSAAALLQPARARLGKLLMKRESRGCKLIHQDPWNPNQHLWLVWEWFSCNAEELLACDCSSFHLVNTSAPNGCRRSHLISTSQCTLFTSSTPPFLRSQHLVHLCRMGKTHHYLSMPALIHCPGVLRRWFLKKIIWKVCRPVISLLIIVIAQINKLGGGSCTAGSHTDTSEREDREGECPHEDECRSQASCLWCAVEISPNTSSTSQWLLPTSVTACVGVCVCDGDDGCQIRLRWRHSGLLGVEPGNHSGKFHKIQNCWFSGCPHCLVTTLCVRAYVWGCASLQVMTPDGRVTVIILYFYKHRKR